VAYNIDLRDRMGVDVGRPYEDAATRQRSIRAARSVGGRTRMGGEVIGAEEEPTPPTGPTFAGPAAGQPRSPLLPGAIHTLGGPRANAPGAPPGVEGAFEFIRRGGARVSEGLSGITSGFAEAFPTVDSFWSALSAFVPASKKTKEGVKALTRAETGVGKAAVGVVGVAASPFVAAVDTARIEAVRNSPVMRDMFEAQLGALPEGRGADPIAQSETARIVLDQTRDLMQRAARDQTLGGDTRAAASIVGGLIMAEDFAELAGPQIVRSVPTIARAVTNSALWRRLNGVRADRIVGPQADQLRLSALASADDELTRAADSVAASAPTTPAGVVQQKVTLSQIVADRALVRAQRSGLGDVVETLSSQDEAALLDGIRQTAMSYRLAVESVERPHLGLLLEQAVRRSERRVRTLTERAATEGLVSKMRTVTEGVTVENKPVRARRFVSELDELIEGIESAALRAGQPIPEEVLLPLREHRAAAYDYLRSVDAQNAALARAQRVARFRAREAGKAETAAKGETKKAETALRGAQKKTEKAAGAYGRATETAQAKASEGIETLEQRQARIAERLRTAKEARVRIVGDPNPQGGYLSEDVAEVWDTMRMHTGKIDSPAMVDSMTAYVKAHGPEIEDAVRHVSWRTITNDLAEMTSAKLDDLRKALPETTELTRTLYVAKQVLIQKVHDWHDLGTAVRDGRATGADLDRATAELMQFSRSVTAGVGETGRALGAQRIVNKELAGRIVEGNQTARMSYARMERLAKQIDQLDAEIGAVKAGAETPKVVAARLKMERLVQDFDAAAGDFDRARAAAAVTSREAERVYLETAIKLGADKEKLAALSFIEPDDVAGILTFLRELKPPTVGERFTRYLLANTYGGFPGVVANVVNTGLSVLKNEALIRPATKLTAPIAERIANVPYSRVSGETRAAWTGLFTSIPDAARIATAAVVTGESPAQLAIRYGVRSGDIASMLGVADSPLVRGVKGLLVESSLRFLQAPDLFWKAIQNMAEARALIMRDAYAAGKGDAAAAAQLTGLLTQPSHEQILRASDVGRRITMNMPAQRSGGNFYEQLQRGILNVLDANVGGFAPLRVLVPAARFGMNQAQLGAQLSGFGVVSGVRLAARARNANLPQLERVGMTRQASTEMAEGALGAMNVVIASNLYDQGLMTGAYPDSPTERQEWDRQHKQEMSIKIGGRWLPMGLLGPLGAPFAIVAIVRDQLATTDDATVQDRIARISGGVGRYLSDQPAFTATRELLDVVYSALNYGGSVALDRWSSLQASKIIPSGAEIRSMTAVFDHYKRDPDGFVEWFYSRFPSTPLTPGSQQVRPQVDPTTGQPVERAVTGPGAAISYGGAQERTLTPAQLEQVDDPISRPGSRIGGEPITPDERNTYERLAGTAVADGIAKLIETEAYKAAPTGQAKQAMRMNVVNEARQDARAQIAAQALARAKDPIGALHAALMVRSTANEASRPWTYTAALAALDRSKLLTPEVIGKIDESRSFRPDGTAASTVAEQLKIAPLVEQYMALPPFRQGDNAEWAELRRRLRDLAEVRARDVRAADKIERSDPILRRYAGGRVDDPRRERLLARNPELRPYIAGSTYWQELR
jgi:hypothetical protein